MSIRRRIAMTALSALVLAVTILGEDWALLPAASTVAIGRLGSLIYQPSHPWNEETPVLPAYVWIVFVALGLLARRIWDHFRSQGAPTLSEVGR